MTRNRLPVSPKKNTFDIWDCYLVLTLFINMERRFEAQFLTWFYPKQWKYQTALTRSFEDFQKLYFFPAVATNVYCTISLLLGYYKTIHSALKFV